MRHTLPQSHQFYVTAPQPCPYLPGKVERKLFTALQGDGARHLNDVLSHQGFRRSQNVLYRPSCAGCSACLSARIVVADFAPIARPAPRARAATPHLERVSRSPWATEAQYHLFRRYLDARHATGGMADMDMSEFAAMIEESPVRSRVIEYYRPAPGRGRPPARGGLPDRHPLGRRVDGLFLLRPRPRRATASAATSSSTTSRSPRESGLPYVYLGYWVPGSAKMDYKARYQPLEIFAEGRWTAARRRRHQRPRPPPRRPPRDQRAGRRDRAAASPR